MGEELLAELGYNVTSRTNSKEALALLKEDPYRFDLVISDQTMPDITGVELAKEIIALRPDMPVILCTGFSHTVDEKSARAAGINAFAMKPLTKGRSQGRSGKCSTHSLSSDTPIAPLLYRMPFRVYIFITL